MKKIPNAEPIFRLLKDNTVAKLDISIADDLKDLMEIQPFYPQNFFDLNDTVREIGIQHMGDRKLAALCLEYRISKRQRVSNWENEELTEKQQRYAATDAWVCLAIQKKLRFQGHID